MLSGLSHLDVAMHRDFDFIVLSKAVQCFWAMDFTWVCSIGHHRIPTGFPQDSHRLFHCLTSNIDRISCWRPIIGLPQTKMLCFGTKGDTLTNLSIECKKFERQRQHTLGWPTTKPLGAIDKVFFST